MKNKKKARESEPSSKRLMLLKLIAVLLPFIFILFFEGLLRIAGYGDDFSLFVRHPVGGYENYLMVNPEIGKKYFQKLEYTSPANDIFLREKPEGAFRVFVMGSSVVYGFPHDRNLMFSRILHQMLSDAYPGRKIEMVNTSITAINTFTLRDFIGQILRHEPDAILIYEGHNEFYGAFGIGSNETMSRNYFLARLHISLMESRVYQLLRVVINGISGKLSGKDPGGVPGTLMRRIVADKDILYNSREYVLTMERFTQNMGYILKRARKRGVPVFLSEVVSNIHGMEPFNSIAVDTLEAAIDVFARARLAEGRLEYDSARKLYYLAKDLDCLRFRASEDINVIIGRLAKGQGVFMVPMLSHFESHSPNGLIGNNLMTEHVHPNIDGAFLMAGAFFRSLGTSGVPGEPNGNVYPVEYYRRNWGYTLFDRLLAHHRIQLLMGQWPFVLDEDEMVNYGAVYRPRFHLDSLAFSVMKNPGLSFSEVRLQLAGNYERSGMTEQAYREYESLLRMNPYIPENYRDAASCLLQLEDLPLALDYLLKSLEYERSFFAMFRIAEIYLIMSDYSHAIRYFDASLAIAPADRQVNVLGKLYTALVYANDRERALQIAAELESRDARQFLRVPFKRYVFDEYIPFQTKEQVNEAKRLITDGANNEAIDILETSLKIYDSHIANRMLGELYLKQEDPGKASHHFGKVYELFKFDAKFLHSFILSSIATRDFDRAGKCLQDLELYHPGHPQLELLRMMLP